MNKIKLLFCAAVLFTGCALSDFSDYENHDLLSLNQEMSLTSKQVYYYYSGDTYTFTLPDTTVPDMSRRTLYVNIINPY